MSRTEERPIEDLKYGDKVQFADKVFVVETIEFDVTAPNGALADVLVHHRTGWFATHRGMPHTVVLD